MSQEDRLNKKLPLEISLQIADLLSVQDLLNAGSSSKFFYMAFSNEIIWKTAYTKLLKGYPVDQFVITDAVRNVKRQKFVQFDALEKTKCCHLEDWMQSWKQRCVFAAHILQVQGEMATKAQQKPNCFHPPRSTRSWDSALIKSEESKSEVLFPIDFVLFLLNFAHKLKVQDSVAYTPTLGTGLTFVVENAWQNAVERTQFCNYNAAQPDDIQEKGLEGLSEATVEFLNQKKKMLSLLQLFNDTFAEGDDCLSLMVSTKSDLQAQQPRLVDKETLHIDLLDMHNGIRKVFAVDVAMNNGIGKVFAVVETNTPSYQLYPIAESFTDYLIQYIATVITTDGLALIDSETGYNDLMMALPKSQGLPLSILLPQAKGWNMYSWEKRFIIPSIHSYMKYKWGRIDEDWSYFEAFNNPENVRIPDPPMDIISGWYKRPWKPYWQHLMSQKYADMPISLVQLEKGTIPEKQEINSVIYQIQQRMLNDWIESTPSSVKVARQSDFELESVRKATAKLIPLVELFRQRLPVLLYYAPPRLSIRPLYIYKYLLDHLSCLEQNSYKYDTSQLRRLHTPVRIYLAYMSRWQSNSDAAGLEIDWTPLESTSNE